MRKEDDRGDFSLPSRCVASISLRFFEDDKFTLFIFHASLYLYVHLPCLEAYSEPLHVRRAYYYLD